MEIKVGKNNEKSLFHGLNYKNQSVNYINQTMNYIIQTTK